MVGNDKVTGFFKPVLDAAIERAAKVSEAWDETARIRGSLKEQDLIYNLDLDGNYIVSGPPGTGSRSWLSTGHRSWPSTIADPRC